MQKLAYPLNQYIKAVEILVQKKHLRCVEVTNKRGSAVHFEIFENDSSKPLGMWQVHTEHKNKRKITSKEDYRKAAKWLNCSLDEFIEVLESL